MSAPTPLTASGTLGSLDKCIGTDVAHRCAHRVRLRRGAALGRPWLATRSASTTTTTTTTTALGGLNETAVISLLQRVGDRPPLLVEFTPGLALRLNSTLVISLLQRVRYRPILIDLAHPACLLYGALVVSLLQGVGDGSGGLEILIAVERHLRRRRSLRRRIAP